MAEFFKTDEMSREEYLTWTVQQHGDCLSIEGYFNYKSEEIKAEYARKRQRQRQDEHGSSEFNSYQFRLCTQGTAKTNAKHFCPVPDEYEVYFLATSQGSMDWDKFYEDSEKPQQ